MKYERGLNILKFRNLSRSVICEAIQLLDFVMDALFHPKEACTIREIASKWGSGMSIEQIAAEIDMPRDEVYRYLKIAEELCADAIMACQCDEFIEQETLFGDVEDVVVYRITKDDRPKAQYRKKRSAPLFQVMGDA